jgi:hypothetical protein
MRMHSHIASNLQATEEQEEEEATASKNNREVVEAAFAALHCR